MTVQTARSPVQFTREDMQKFKETCSIVYREQLAPALSIIFKEKAVLDEKKAVLDEKKAVLDEKKAILDETMNELNIRDAKADQMLADVAKKGQELSKQRQELVAKQFYSIFHGRKPLPAEEIDTLFNTYLADGTLCFGKSSEGANCAKISSMNGVIKYLADHSDIKACDFRVFKTEIQDIPTLAKFLKSSTVKAIAINSSIPTVAKTILTEAIAARDGGLKVQYFA